ncbi:hypothetical protein MMC09_004925 [Bachmanniomyces sp. S44760]|nr:hypothetical protein [Bachmanniomyces sp. S44760]
MRLQESVLLVFLAALMVEAGPLPSNKILSKREDGQPQTNQPTTGPIAVTGVSAACTTCMTTQMKSLVPVLATSWPFPLPESDREFARTAGKSCTQSGQCMVGEGTGQGDSGHGNGNGNHKRDGDQGHHGHGGEAHKWSKAQFAPHQGGHDHDGNDNGGNGGGNH